MGISTEGEFYKQRDFNEENGLMVIEFHNESIFYDLINLK